MSIILCPPLRRGNITLLIQLVVGAGWQKLPDSNLPAIQSFLDIFFIIGISCISISAKEGIFVVIDLLTKVYLVKRNFNKLLWIYSKMSNLLKYKLFSPYSSKQLHKAFLLYYTSQLYLYLLGLLQQGYGNWKRKCHLIRSSMASTVLTSGVLPTLSISCTFWVTPGLMVITKIIPAEGQPEEELSASRGTGASCLSISCVSKVFVS